MVGYGLRFQTSLREKDVQITRLRLGSQAKEYFIYNWTGYRPQLQNLQSSRGY